MEGGRERERREKSGLIKNWEITSERPASAATASLAVAFLISLPLNDFSVLSK